MISLLKSLDADIIALQECDLGCGRSGSVDVTSETAKALKFAAAFVAEFEEIDSAARSERDAGCGVHGNAVLCRWGFIGNGDDEEGAFAVPHVSCYDWEVETEKAAALSSAATTAAASEAPGGGRFLSRLFSGGPGRRGRTSNNTPASREPRRGRRVALGACCRVPLEKLGLEKENEKRKTSAEKEGKESESASETDDDFAVLLAYSLHLECFCGATGRALQLRDVLRDARSRLPGLSRKLLQLPRKKKQGESESSSSSASSSMPSSSSPSLSSASASASPPSSPLLFCSILGDLNTLAHGIVRLSPLRAKGRARWSSLGSTEARWLHQRVLSRVEGEEKEQKEKEKQASPPRLFFECPFPLDTVTFDNPSYHFWGRRLRLVKGKLDWALLLKKEKEKEKKEKEKREDKGEVEVEVEKGEDRTDSPPPPCCCYRGLRALSATTANDDFAASDHRALVVEVAAEE